MARWWLEQRPSKLSRVKFTGSYVRILPVASDQKPDPSWLKPNRKLLAHTTKWSRVEAPWYLAWLGDSSLAPLSGSSPTVVPRWCQISWICMCPVPKQQEKANCALLFAQSKVLEISFLVTKDLLFTLEQWPGVWVIPIGSPCSWKQSAPHPSCSLAVQINGMYKVSHSKGGGAKWTAALNDLSKGDRCYLASADCCHVTPLNFWCLDHPIFKSLIIMYKLLIFKCWQFI